MHLDDQQSIKLFRYISISQKVTSKWGSKDYVINDVSSQEYVEDSPGFFDGLSMSSFHGLHVNLYWCFRRFINDLHMCGRLAGS